MKNLLTKTGFLFFVSGIGAISFLLPETAHKSLYFHKDLIPQGEYWRFVSGHFIYSSWWHWTVNTLGISVLLVLFNSAITSYKWIAASLFTLSFIGIGLLILSQELVWYIGFSGILAGLYIYAAVTSYPHNKPISIVVILLFSLFSVWQLSQGELVQGSLTISSSSYAHALGVAGGGIFAFAMQAYTKAIKR